MEIKISENLSFVIIKLTEIVNDLNDGRLIKTPTERALELMILYDIKDLIAPCKHDGVFDIEQMKKILTNKYLESIKLGSTACFYNYQQVLSKKDLVKHLKAILI